MNNSSSIADPAVEVVAIARSSFVFRPLIEKNPDLLALLVQAAEAANTSAARARLIEALTRATSASDKAVDVICSGDDVEIAKWTFLASRANENLGLILRELCGAFAPIGSNVSAPS